jgi:hypothetical protein
MKLIHCSLYVFFLNLFFTGNAVAQQAPVILQLSADSTWVSGAHVFTVKVRAWNMKNLNTVQFPISFNKQEVEYIGLEHIIGLPGISSSNYTAPASANQRGIWVISWDDAFPYTSPSVDDGALIVALRFRMKNTAATTFKIGDILPGVEISQYIQSNGKVYVLPTDPVLPLTVLSNGTAPIRNVFSLYASALQLKEGEIGCMPLTTEHFDSILTTQYALHYDPAVLEAVYIQNYQLPGNDAMDFNIQHARGTILVAWATPNLYGVSLPRGSSVYEVCFKAIGEAGSFSAIDINGEGFMWGSQAEIVNVWFQDLAVPGFGVSDTIRIISTGQISVGSKEAAANDSIALQAQPTCFSTSTLLNFNLEEATNVQMSVVDVEGRTVWQQKGQFEGGTHTVALQKEELGAPGFYYAVLQTPRGRGICKLVAL